MGITEYLYAFGPNVGMIFIPLASRASIFVGSHYTAIYRNCREPTRTMVLIVEERGSQAH